MNPIEKVIRRVDAVQQRHKATAFAVGLIKKYGDDNAGVLVANLAHSAFVSLFPLLLVLVTLLGLVASNNPRVRHQVLQAIAHRGRPCRPGRPGAAEPAARRPARPRVL